MTIRNINTSTDLFTSSIGSQDFNATFIPGQVLIINSGPTIENPGREACNDLIVEFGAYPVLIGLLGTIILLGAVIFTLTTGFITLKTSSINKGMLFGGILTVVSIAILIIVAIVIFGSLCVLL